MWFVGGLLRDLQGLRMRHVEDCGVANCLVLCIAVCVIARLNEGGGVVEWHPLDEHGERESWEGLDGVGVELMEE